MVIKRAIRSASGPEQVHGVRWKESREKEKEGTRETRRERGGRGRPSLGRERAGPVAGGKFAVAVPGRVAARGEAVCRQGRIVT